MVFPRLVDIYIKHFFMPRKPWDHNKGTFTLNFEFRLKLVPLYLPYSPLYQQ